MRLLFSRVGIRPTIVVKLAAAFGVLAAVMLITLVVASNVTGQLGDDVKVVGDQSVPSVQLLGEMTTEMRQVRVAQLEHSLSADRADKKEMDGEIAQTATGVERLFTQYRKLSRSSRDTVFLRRAQADWRHYVSLSRGFATFSRRGDRDGAFAVLSGKADEVYDVLKTDVASWSDFDRKAATQRARTARHAASSARTT